ncbi:MAG: hypothetical protein CL869_05235 [Cytophagia bacterium]|nr:hypothetical protein [Cytophagia bacterium]|tara:strand:- start:215 stop:706 length:492 start_codon:yes stop_codon:yes gene_type:complete
MFKISFILLIFISFLSKSKDHRSVLNASGGTSTLKTIDKSYRVQYSIGQQGPIGKIKSMIVNVRQGFIQPPRLIEKNLILDNILKVKISPNPFREALDVVFSEEIKNKIKVKIYDLMGKLVFDDELPIKTQHKIYLNSIPDSQFILRLEGKEKYFQTKIIKRK